MRILKFRVWDGKVMVYPKVVEIGVNNINGLTSASYSLDGGGYCTSADAMQFTGLVDKQGKEIYEGDIVKSNWGQRLLAEIVYEDAAFILSYLKGSQCDMAGEDNNKSYEVIGNVYEHGYLLDTETEKC